MEWAWRSPRLGMTLLLSWMLLLFFSNLSAPVTSDEALYASVSRDLARGQDWFALQFNGQPFYYKPPLHFWMGALSIRIWGENEWALRFPSAASGLLTLLLICGLGRQLFDSRTGLLAALIGSTTYILLYMARQGKMDVELGLLINLGFAGFFLAYRNAGRRWIYLALAFLAMAVATLLKGPLGLLLPGTAGAVYLLVTRRARIWRETGYLLAGLGFFLAIVVPYYWRMSPEFNHYFFLVENFNRITEVSKPALYYSYMIFVEFLPWSLFWPCLAAFFWKTRGHLRWEEADRALAVWAGAFFVFLCLPTYKEEDFLVYLVPALTLLQARLWIVLAAAPADTFRLRHGGLFRISALLLACGFALALFVSPIILRWRHPSFPDFLPAHFVVPALIACGMLLYSAARPRPTGILLWTGILAAGFAIIFVHAYSTAAGRYNTSRDLAQDIRARTRQAPLFLSCVEGMSELLFYVDRPQPVPFIGDPTGIAAALHSQPSVFGLMLREQYDGLQRAGKFPATLIAEYPYGKWRYALVRSASAR